VSLSALLRLNAMFTLVCGLGSLLAGKVLVHHTGLPSLIWTGVLGMALLSYVPLLLFAAAWPVSWLVWTIIGLDWAYVALVTGWLMLHWQGADLTGIALVAGTTLAVAAFAILQTSALPRITGLSRP
jgi:hypothetical protein